MQRAFFEVLSHQGVGAGSSNPAGVVETVSVTTGRMTPVVDGACHLITTVHLPPGPASAS
ncbi:MULTISPECIES: hypothetical protein [unclassified Streptomyces]|uniref:hypothetical protein n=1 Tax=unclassified Streptomyces TaxID=2593676 RepID=UPI0038692AA0